MRTLPTTAALAVTVWIGVGLAGDFLLIHLLNHVRGLSYLRLSALLMLCILQQGCLFHRKHKPAVARTYVPLPIPVGTITLVNEDAQFVLVDNGTLPVPPIGGTLKAYPSGTETASAELVATNVTRRPFTIADIRRGSPHKGDRVVYLPPELRKPKALEERAASPLPPQAASPGPADQ